MMVLIPNDKVMMYALLDRKLFVYCILSNDLFKGWDK